jgi:hypothetical protein
MGRKTGSLNHTHKYYKLEGLWFCGSAGCTHFMPKNMPPPVYKKSICWTCRLPLELNPDNMQSTHPVHENCEPFIYVPPIPVAELESMEEHIERQLRESQQKKRMTEASTTKKTESGIKVEIAHTDGCASHSGQSCDCGAQ